MSEFQSLLHQGISLLVGNLRIDPPAPESVSIPSSSGHQFTDKRDNASLLMAFEKVSIPSSSGHQFTALLKAET